MLHNDTVKLRRRFYLWQLISYIIQDGLGAGVMTVQRYAVIVEDHSDGKCLEESCLYGTMPYFAIFTAGLVCRILWHIY